MEITEVRIKLMEDSDDRLQAFCSITFDDCFVVRDLKIIEGAHGAFVAMPSRKLSGRCSHCGGKNMLRSSYCNHCGKKQQDEPLPRDSDGRPKLYADIAHPINSKCREMVQSRVIQEYRSELDRSEQPGYISRYDDSYDDSYDDEYEFVDEEETDGVEPQEAPAATDASAEPQQADENGSREASTSGSSADGSAKGGDLPDLKRPHTQLQPPESQPRAPHSRTSRPTPQPARKEAQDAPGDEPELRQPSEKPRPDDSFGAGIFE